jgi:hypothetical protein
MANAKMIKNKFDAFHLMLFVIAFAAIGAAVVAFTSAAGKGGSSSVTGTIEMVENAGTLKYGDTVSFKTTISGKVSPNSYFYTKLVCRQGTTVVYHRSAAIFDQNGQPIAATYSLTDQGDPNLFWDGKAATCSVLFHDLNEKGTKNLELYTLDSIQFDVAGQ